jgi:hypothetical protein
MRVETKDGGDGVRCWNVVAIQRYADQVNEKESRLSATNPDLLVMPGLVKCYGCEVMEYDYGVKCTAQLTRTRYAVQGEVQPRAEDAAGSLGDIPGLATRAPADIASADSPSANVAPALSVATEPSSNASKAAQAKRPGLRGLFGRS